MRYARFLLVVAISVGLMGFLGACGGHSQVTTDGELASDQETTVSSATPTEAAINMTKEAVSASMSVPSPSAGLSKAAPAGVADRCETGPHGNYSCPGGGSIRIDGDCLLAESDDCALILEPLVLVFSDCASNDGYTIDGTLVLSAILYMPGCSAVAELTMALDAASENLVVSGSNGTEDITGFEVTVSPDGIEIVSDSAPGDIECAINADCQALAAPLICLDGTCQPPCSSDDDCRDDAVCINDPNDPAWADLGFTGLDDMGICGDELPIEACDNGIDDDFDGDIDCDDLDCASLSACIPEVCDNEEDDDLDGSVDCDDDECFLSMDCEYDCGMLSWPCQFAALDCIDEPYLCSCPSGNCDDLTADQYCAAALWDAASCVQGCCKTVDPVCDLSAEGAEASCKALVDEEWCLCTDPVTGEEVACDDNFTGDWCSAWWWDDSMTTVDGCCVLEEPLFPPTF